MEEYPESVSYDVIRDVLSFSETRMVDLLISLEKKNIIQFDDSTKEVTYVNIDCEVEVVENQTEYKQYMLNKTEEEAYEIIREVILNYDNYAPRYVLEGALLYGELELTPKRTYNIIVSLENKQLLRRIEKFDGEYYTI